MSNSRTALACCLLLSVLSPAGCSREASDQNTATKKTPDQSPTTNKATDQSPATNKATDQSPTTNKTPDQSVTAPKAPDQNVTAPKAPDQNVTAPKAPNQDITLNLGKKVTMKLALIPAGKFMMGSTLSADEVAKRFGSNAEDHADEHPTRQVTIGAPFYMGVTEVTQAQWKAVMGSQFWAKETYVKIGENHAASYISWTDATTFCTKMSKKTKRSVRLPTEAEWEYACRAGTTTAFNYGDDPSAMGDYAWYRSNVYANKEKYAHGVGVMKPNAWGLYDMHGNVYEWCADWYADSYLPAGQAGANADARDPKGPASGKERVARGGSWRSIPAHCRAARRTRFDPASRFNTFGFRVVLESGSGVD